MYIRYNNNSLTGLQIVWNNKGNWKLVYMQRNGLKLDNLCLRMHHNPFNCMILIYPIVSFSHYRNMCVLYYYYYYFLFAQYSIYYSSNQLYSKFYYLK